MVKIYRAGLTAEGHAIRTITDTDTGRTTISRSITGTGVRQGTRGKTTYKQDIRTIDTPIKLTRTPMELRKQGISIYDTNQMRNLDIATGVGVTRNEEAAMIAKIQDENLKFLAYQGQPAAQQIINEGLSYQDGTITPSNINAAFPVDTGTPTSTGMDWKMLLLIGAGAMLLLGRK